MLHINSCLLHPAYGTSGNFLNDDFLRLHCLFQHQTNLYTTHAIYSRAANALKSYLVHFRAIHYVCYAITDLCPSILLNFCYISYRYTVKKGIPHGSQCSHVSQKKTCFYTRQCLVMRNSGLIPYRVTRFWLPGIIFPDKY